MRVRKTEKEFQACIYSSLSFDLWGWVIFVFERRNTDYQFTPSNVSAALGGHMASNARAAAAPVSTSTATSSGVNIQSSGLPDFVMPLHPSGFATVEGGTMAIIPGADKDIKKSMRMDGQARTNDVR